MYQRRSPDFTRLVIAAMQRYPAEWEAARERPDGSRDDRFIRLLAWEASKVDANIGLNGKRGSDTLSADALAYKNPTAPGGAEVIDVIVGATHEPSWQDATIPPVPEPGSIPHLPNGVPGRYIAPQDPGGVVPVEPDPDTGTPPPQPAALEARLVALERRVQELQADISGASLDATDARALADQANERVSGLKITGTIDVPVVVSKKPPYRARAKGDIKLMVSE